MHRVYWEDQAFTFDVSDEFLSGCFQNCAELLHMLFGSQFHKDAANCVVLVSLTVDCR